MTTQEQNAENAVVLKYDHWILKMLKRHGLSFGLMAGGLWFLNGKLTTAEVRIAALETRLYDCYEKRIMVRVAYVSTDFPHNTSVPTLSAYLCCIPSKQRKQKSVSQCSITA